MPISPNDLLARTGLTIQQSIQWGNVPSATQPGVYVISLSKDPMKNDGLLDTAPIDPQKVQTWINRVPTFTLKGTCSPSAISVCDYLQQFWFDDESIVYIGMATSLRTRLSQFRGHVLGNRKPHAGGHWLKTFHNPSDLYIHYAILKSRDEAKQKEDDALMQFKTQVSSKHQLRLSNSIPFANREHPQGNRKQHDLRGDVLRD